MVSKSKSAAPKKVIIDCSIPVLDKVLDLSTFESFLHSRIKVNGKCPAPAGEVNIVRDRTKLTVTFNNSQNSKRYLKYLTKKYLKKQQLKEYLRVIMSSKNSYTLKYYKIDMNQDDADAAE